MTTLRVGIGFDVHRFDDSRPLILGGVHIPVGKGLAGHSDADVLCHATCDAVLGAASLGDIGLHFPDSDPAWKDTSSLSMLETVHAMLKPLQLRVVNIDSTVMLESPKIAPYRELMKTMIASALGVEAHAVSVKATTMEGLGTVGRGEGAACMAVALLTDE
jgi:2-C-methyl-D-erythritol 2,4-cyclodiphosphate synthase